MAIFGPFGVHNRPSGGRGWLSLCPLIVSAASIVHFDAENLEFLAFFRWIFRHFFEVFSQKLLWEALRSLRRPQGGTGEAPGGFQKAQEASRRLQEAQGSLQEASRRPQELPGGLRRPQEAPLWPEKGPKVARNRRRKVRKKSLFFVNPSNIDECIG